MRVYLALALCVLPAPAAEDTPPAITRVQVEGSPAPSDFETRAGDLLDSAHLQHDVKALWRSQRFSDVRAETTPDQGGVAVVFRVQPRRTVRLENIHVQPPTPGITVGIAPGAEIDEAAAQHVAAGIRKQLLDSGHPDAAVEARLVPRPGGTADLKIDVNMGRQIDISAVTFSGHPGVPAADLRKALRATRSRTMIPGIWKLHAGYNSDSVQADAANLRSFYYERGYFDADVRPDSDDPGGPKAAVDFAVESGPKFRIGALSLDGRTLPLGLKEQFPAKTVCRDLMEERRQAEREGVLDFSALVDVHPERDGAKADVSVTTERGPSYTVGRIEFRGNHRYDDLTLRRSLFLQEGAPMDETLLRKSMARLNETGLFEPLTDRSVVINTPPGSRHADVIFRLREKKLRSWSFSGPVGPMSVAGPLEFSIGSRLPDWGRGIFELSTYAVSAKLLLFAKPIGTLIPFLPNKRFLPLITLQRPALPGQRFLSGAEFIPQLGWQGMLAGYGASQARGLLRGVLETEHSFTPGLPVTVVNGQGVAGTMFCAPPRSVLDRVRQGGGVLTGLAFAFLPF